jgi:uncharacterized membrane protein YqjE
MAETTDKMDEVRGKLAAFMISVAALLLVSMAWLLIGICYSILSLEFFAITLVMILSISSVAALWTNNREF